MIFLLIYNHYTNKITIPAIKLPEIDLGVTSIDSVTLFGEKTIDISIWKNSIEMCKEIALFLNPIIFSWVYFLTKWNIIFRKPQEGENQEDFFFGIKYDEEHSLDIFAIAYVHALLGNLYLPKNINFNVKAINDKLTSLNEMGKEKVSEVLLAYSPLITQDMITTNIIQQVPSEYAVATNVPVCNIYLLGPSLKLHIRNFRLANLRIGAEIKDECKKMADKSKMECNTYVKVENNITYLGNSDTPIMVEFTNPYQYIVKIPFTVDIITDVVIEGIFSSIEIPIYLANTSLENENITKYLLLNLSTIDNTGECKLIVKTVHVVIEETKKKYLLYGMKDEWYKDIIKIDEIYNLLSSSIFEYLPKNEAKNHIKLNITGFDGVKELIQEKLDETKVSEKVCEDKNLRFINSIINYTQFGKNENTKDKLNNNEIENLCVPSKFTDKFKWNNKYYMDYLVYKNDESRRYTGYDEMISKYPFIMSHDAATAYFNREDNPPPGNYFLEGTVRTQLITFIQQLNLGVRCFDWRPYLDTQYESDIGVHHGPIAIKGIDGMKIIDDVKEWCLVNILDLVIINVNHDGASEQIIENKTNQICQNSSIPESGPDNRFGNNLNNLWNDKKTKQFIDTGCKDVVFEKLPKVTRDKLKTKFEERNIRFVNAEEISKKNIYEIMRDNKNKYGKLPNIIAVWSEDGYWNDNYIGSFDRNPLTKIIDNELETYFENDTIYKEQYNSIYEFTDGKITEGLLNLVNNSYNIAPNLGEGENKFNQLQLHYQAYVDKKQLASQNICIENSEDKVNYYIFIKLYSKFLNNNKELNIIELDNIDIYTILVYQFIHGFYPIDITNIESILKIYNININDKISNYYMKDKE